MKVGVFDSGIGGLSVADAINVAMPDIDVIYANDTVNVPYGSKSPNQLLALVVPILDRLVEEGCSVIVIACNTVTTTLIETLRERLAVPLVGIEPMVKPAAAVSSSKIIAVCATPTTLASNRYSYLKQTYAKDITIIQPDCSYWAKMIESENVDIEKISRDINKVLSQGADVIVLACTHYHWIEKLIVQIADNRAIVMQPEAAIVAQLKKVIELLP